jgi:hemerythrin-like domain-containing protein
VADAPQMIRDDHKRVKDLFRQFEDTEDPQQMKRIADKAVRELEVHAELEEKVFYPKVRKEIGEDELMNEAEEEHHVAKLLIAEVSQLKPTDPHFRAKFMVLAESVKHHIEEEESEMLPKAAELGMDRMNKLGEEMAQKKTGLEREVERKEPGEMSRMAVGAGMAAMAGGGTRRSGGTTRRATSSRSGGTRSRSGAAGRTAAAARGGRKSSTSGTSRSRSTGTRSRSAGTTRSRTGAAGRTAAAARGGRKSSTSGTTRRRTTTTRSRTGAAGRTSAAARGGRRSSTSASSRSRTRTSAGGRSGRRESSGTRRRTSSRSKS